MLDLHKKTTDYIHSMWSDALNVWADNYSTGDAHQTMLVNVETKELIFEYTTNRVNNVYPWIELIHVQGNHYDYSVRECYGNATDKEISDDLLASKIIDEHEHEEILTELEERPQENPFHVIDEIKAVHQIWKHEGLLEDQYSFEHIDIRDEIAEQEDKLELVIDFMHEKQFDIENLRLSASGYYLVYQDDHTQTILTIDNAHRWAKECLSEDSDKDLIWSLLQEYETDQSDVQEFQLAE